MAFRSERDAIPQGTLDMLILQTLAQGTEMHGFEIASYIQEHTEDVLQVEEGSLYPALQRLLLDGAITGEWGRTEGNRRARYYRLTKRGQKQLTHQVERYQRVARAIGRLLQPA